MLGQQIICFELLLLAACLMAQEKQSGRPTDPLAGIPSGKTRVVDLSYAINEKLVPWPGDTHVFEAKVKASVEKSGYFSRSFSMLEHYGTHMDAPIHFPPGKIPVDQIPPQRLFGPAVVLDIREEAQHDPDNLLTRERIARWEKAHGRIPEGAVVLLRTGWASHWPDATRYLNQDAAGVMHFPGYSVESVELLIERKVSGLGIDTLSVDYGKSKDFAVHRISHGAGLYHLENLADLSALPESGAFLAELSQ